MIKFTKFFRKAFSSLAFGLIASTVLVGAFTSAVSPKNITAQAMSIPNGEFWKSNFNDGTIWETASLNGSQNLWKKTNEGYYFGTSNKDYNIGKTVAGVFQSGTTQFAFSNKKAYLNVYYKIGVEEMQNYDTAEIQILSTDKSVNKVFNLKKDGLIKGSNGVINSEGVLKLDISEFNGKEMKMYFKFDSVDTLYNSYFGWLIKYLTMTTEQDPVTNPITTNISNLSNTKWSQTEVNLSPDKGPNLWHTVQKFTGPSCEQNIPCIQGFSTSSTHLVYANQNKNDSNYDTGRKYKLGNGGVTTSIDPIVLPQNSKIELKMDYILDVESDQDKDTAIIQVLSLSPENNQTIATDVVWTKKTTDSTNSAPQTIDLSRFAGKKIALQLIFDTVDNIENSGKGWIINLLNIDATANANDPKSNVVWQDNGNQPWTKINSINGVNNLWGQSLECKSPNTCSSVLLYTNDKANYNDGNRNGGIFTSTTIAVPKINPNEKLELNFDSLLDVEQGPYWDKAKVFINFTPEIQCIDMSTSNCSSANNKAMVWEKGNVSKNYETQKADITNYQGKNIKIEFYFDTVDSIGNDTLGWNVKNIKMVKSDNLKI